MVYLLGVDIGTSSTKTLLTDALGNPVAVDSMAYKIQKTPNGGVEQDPEIWWDSVCKTIRGVMESSGAAPGDIAGIGLSGQMHGLTPLDGSGAVIRPAMLWMDARTKKQLAEAPVDKIAEITLNRPATGFLALSLKWMMENEPENYKKISTVLLPKDYIRYRLTGELGTDYSDASGTTAFDPVKLDWSGEILDIFGFDRRVFPECRPSHETAGALTARAAAETGLKAGTPVVYGGGDNPMQNVGNGLISPGLLSSNIGTAAQLATLSLRPDSDKDRRVNTFGYVQKDMWSVVGASLSGGGVLSWLQNDILHCGNYADMDARAAKVTPCPGGLVFLPYLTGQRSPLHNPNAKGVFFGLDRSHTDAHIIRSVMEGIVMSLRCSLEIMEDMSLASGAVIASGGGSRSGLWLQMQADIYNREILTAKVSEQACLGAAIVAAWGVGIYGGLAEACKSMVRLSEKATAPIPENAERYDRYFPVFKSVYEANKPLFDIIAGL